MSEKKVAKKESKESSSVFDIDDLVFCILEFLGSVDLVRLRPTCKMISELAEDVLSKRVPFTDVLLELFRALNKHKGAVNGEYYGYVPKKAETIKSTIFLDNFSDYERKFHVAIKGALEDMKEAEIQDLAAGVFRLKIGMIIPITYSYGIVVQTTQGVRIFVCLSHTKDGSVRVYQVGKEGVKDVHISSLFR